MKVYGNMYEETKNRFHNMKMKMEGGIIEGNGFVIDYSQYSTTPNDPQDELAHRIGGRILGGRVYYYGFEVWGENYVRWELSDFIADGTKGHHDPYGNWHRRKWW